MSDKQTKPEKLAAWVYQQLGEPKRLGTEAAHTAALAAATELFSVKALKTGEVLYTLKHVSSIFTWAQGHPFWVKWIVSVPALVKALLHPENPDNGLEAQYDAAMRLGLVAEDGYTLKEVAVAEKDCVICHGTGTYEQTVRLEDFRDSKRIQEVFDAVDTKEGWSDEKKREVKAKFGTLHQYALKGPEYRRAHVCPCVKYEMQKVFVGTD